jgi:hypothetical protein
MTIKKRVVVRLEVIYDQATNKSWEDFLREPPY